MAEPKKESKKKRDLFHRIVNYFLFFGIGIFLLLLLLIGFTQTSTFREMLRKIVISELNSSIHGTINIGKIDGTLFTNLTVHDITLYTVEDTIADIKEIDVKINPFKLLSKIIFVRSLRITDARFTLVKDSAGVLNISKVFPPSGDTTSSEFPFKIKANSLSLQNVDLRICRFDQKNNYQKTASLDLNNFSVSNFNAQISTESNIAKKDFDVNISDLSCKTNLTDFDIKNFSVFIRVHPKFVELQKFSLNTTRSKIDIDFTSDQLNVFSEDIVRELRTSTMRISLHAEPFHFDDLSTFIQSTQFLKGPVIAQMDAVGNLDALEIDKIDLTYGDTKLGCTGQLARILDGSKMLINTKFSKSNVVMKDVTTLMPSLALPQYSGYESFIFDSLAYSGTPLKFETGFKVFAGGGALVSSCKFDFSVPQASYDITMNAENLQLSEILKYNAVFTGTVAAKGAGFDPQTLSCDLSVNASHSIIGAQIYPRILLNGVLNRGALNSQIAIQSDRDSLSADVATQLFKDSIPQFTASLRSYNLNLAVPLQDSSMKSNLTFKMKAEGRGLNPEFFNGKITLECQSSNIFDSDIDPLRAELLMRSSYDMQKEIHFKSDVIDADVTGNFALSTIAPLTVNQMKKIISGLNDRLSHYIKEYSSNGTMGNTGQVDSAYRNTKYDPVKLKYNIVFKDMALLNTFLKHRDLQIDGNISGTLNTSKTVFAFTMNADIPALTYQDRQMGFFGRAMNFSVKLEHPESRDKFEDWSGELTANSERFYFDTDFKKMALDLQLQKGGALNLDVEGTMEDKTSMKLKSYMILAPDTLKMFVQDLEANYNLFQIRNKKPAARIACNQSNISIRDFVLLRGDQSFALQGTFSPMGEQNLNLNVSNLKGYDIYYNILNNPGNEIIDYDINLKANIRGTLANPKITLDLDVDSLRFKKLGFGSLTSRLVYQSQKCSIDVKLIDDPDSTKLPRLTLTGSVPIDLGLREVKERLIRSGDLLLNLEARQFDLRVISELVPGVKELRGLFDSRLTLSGTVAHPEKSGYVSLSDVGFKVLANNLDYTASLQAKLDDRELTLEDVTIQNAGKVKNRGIIHGSGSVDISDLENISTNIKIKGDLTVLSPDSKLAGSPIYGNLFIATDGDIAFSTNSERAFVDVPLLIKEANLTFSSSQSGYQGPGDNFFYRYPAQEAVVNVRDKTIDELKDKFQSQRGIETIKKSSPFNLDYNVSVKIKDEANFVFVLSPEANQKLNAVLKGDLFFKRKDGIQNFQGELNVVEGSTLDFIKSFSAAGSLRFESDVTNPYLNIIGTYKGFYTENDTAAASSVKEEEVAVKVRLTGPLKELSKNFTEKEDNIAVYFGKSNIEKDVASTEYDKADAIWFVLLGKFKKDITQQDRTKAAGQIDPITGTATSLASSFVGSLLNTYLGDAVKSLEFRNIGTATKFNLSGRFKNFRYTLGGSTNFLQDFSTANIRIEYPLFDNLIMRVERKEATTQANYNYEMMNEFGVRYRIEF